MTTTPWARAALSAARDLPGTEPRPGTGLDASQVVGPFSGARARILKAGRHV